MIIINYKFVEPAKWPNFSWTCHAWPSHCSKWNNICTFPSFHTYRRELPSYRNLLALCTTQSCSLGVNPTKTYLIYMYVIMCIFIYVQGAIIIQLNVHIMWILNTHVSLRYTIISQQLT
jgi:hypothetical protein